MTIVEKIFAAHADRDVVRPGEFVAAGVDLVLANGITGPPTIAQFRRMGATRVFDPDRVALVPDHFTPPKDVYVAALISALRAFAREQHIPHYWEMGEVGIEHTLLPQEGLVRG
jgi:3-isopropylmalate/(R)-2-methylmalate dehydratase large subunit